MFPYENNRRGEYEMKDNITDWAHETYKIFYEDKSITKEDIFYYTYGILHHSGYKKQYKNNLSHELPRIPMTPDFRVFEEAGRKLADLHLNYETCDRYDLGEPLNPIADYPESIRFEKGGNQTTLFINSVKIYDNLPVPNYKVNGRTPVGWLTFVPKKSQSGINRRIYRVFTGEQIRAMIERLTHVGLESDKIIKKLNKLDFEHETNEWKKMKEELNKRVKIKKPIQQTLN